MKRQVMALGMLVSACATTQQPSTPVAAASDHLPTGGLLTATGYLTIREVPSSPYSVDPPPEPTVVDDFARRTVSPDPAVRAKAWEDANGTKDFQAELERLRQVLARREPDNFVELRLVRDPAVAAEVWFKHDAARTLARYTSNPLFRPRQGGLTSVEEERLRKLWLDRMEGGQLINMIGVNRIDGVVELGIAVEEPEFRRIAAERGWGLGPEVKLMFPPARAPAFTDPKLSKLVRVFARETKAKSIQLLAASTGRIVLEDGCFRLASPRSGERGALVMFGRQTQLGTDEQGYLVLLSEEGRARYRIGEIGRWGGPNGVDQNDPALRELRQACGDDRVINVAEPESERLAGLPYPDWVADHARAKALSYREAWKQVIACMKREEDRGRKGLDARDRCIRQFN